MNAIAENQIRALFDDATIRVYQAYNDEIADTALANGTFVSPPFKLHRMTWIKPSFLWMMYRSGWGYKDDNQRRILAIDLKRTGFEWALTHSCSTHRNTSMSPEEWTKLSSRAPVRIQWDPERDIHLRPLPYRSIQVGLSKEAVRLFISEWIENVTDITGVAHSMCALLQKNEVDAAQAMLPSERIYPYPRSRHSCHY